MIIIKVIKQLKLMVRIRSVALTALLKVMMILMMVKMMTIMIRMMTEKCNNERY